MKAALPDGFPYSDKPSLTPNTVRKGVGKGCDTRFARFLAERFNAPKAESQDRAEPIEGETRGVPGRTVSA